MRMALRKVKKRTRVPLQKRFQQVLKNKSQRNHEAPVNKPNKKALFIAQEIKVARLLANNDKKIRDRVLKNLKKWLTVRSKSSLAFTETELMRLWKGLFYCMWMSDKPIIQEELAESLSQLVHCFQVKTLISLYTACALKTLGTEWYGLDQYRLDKFAMLARRIIRQTFETCRKSTWDIDWVEDISQILEKLLLDAKICIGFKMHLTELYMEELSKISQGNISEDAVAELVKPFAVYLVTMDDERQIRHVMKHIFRYLIIQSDIGLDYMEKFQAWKQAGFPTGSIDAMELVELPDQERGENEEVEKDTDNTTEEKKVAQNQAKCNTQKVLDPRAGKVDVELPQIPFDPKKITQLLSRYKFHSSSTTKSRRQILRLINEFTELSEGHMPLGMKEIRLPNTRKKDTDSKAAALRLLEFDRSLYSDQEQGKRKRKKKKQLNADESEDDNTVESETVKKVEMKTVKKKRGMHCKTHDVANSVESNLQELNPPDIDAKNKKIKTGKQSQNAHKAQAQTRNRELKKSVSTLTDSDGKCKNTKPKPNVMIAAKKLNIAASVKTKKATIPKVCGNWNVSDNVALTSPSPLTNSDTPSHVETNGKTLPRIPVGKSNTISMLSRQTKWLIPVAQKLENQKMKTPHVGRQQIKLKNTHSKSKKRVKIVLQRNTAQHTSEYIQKLRQSPAIPFDANRKPLVGVLKASPIPSPINPFYKKNMK